MITVILSSLRLFKGNKYLVISIPNLPQSPHIEQSSDGGISDFRISSQSLIKENFHNSKTSDDIDMKLEPVTKLDKKKKNRQKKLTMTSCQ